MPRWMRREGALKAGGADLFADPLVPVAIRVRKGANLLPQFFFDSLLTGLQFRFYLGRLFVTQKRMIYGVSADFDSGGAHVTRLIPRQHRVDDAIFRRAARRKTSVCAQRLSQNSIALCRWHTLEPFNYRFQIEG